MPHRHGTAALQTRVAVFALALAALALPGTAQIAGDVFFDFNSNAVDDGFNESPAAGVVVTATDAAGTPTSTVTDANGFYLLLVPNGRYIVTFSNLPAGAFPVASGPGGNAAVRGVTAPAFPVSLAVNVPEDHNDPNARLALPVFANGDPTLPGSSAAAPGLHTVDYDGTNGSFDTTASATGACWGAAWQRGAQKLYMAAAIRRHAGLGTLGTGGIYVVDYSSGTPTPSNFVDLATLGALTGGNPHSFLPSSLLVANHDTGAFNAVGKSSLGGIDLAADDRTLFVMSLANRTLYRMDVGPSGVAPGSIAAFPVPNPGCIGGQHRPWAVKCYRGKVYVGVVCDGSTSGATNANLSATVYEMDQNADPNAFTMTSVLSFPLDYAKGFAVDGFVDTNKWNNWISTWPTPYVNSAFFYTYPQPMLTDLDIETDGSMILGLTDRFSMQVGSLNFQPDVNDITVYQGGAGGDLLRASKTGATWAIEQNGTVAGQTSLFGAANGQGPGGGEFFAFEFYTLTHQEIALGAVATLPGRFETVATTYDQTDFFQGGMHYFSNATAFPTDTHTIYSSGNIGVGGKANGLGDVEPQVAPAPLQIGNLVWLDSDADGVQDANEPGASFVTVSLRDCSGNLVAQTTTDALGNYLFTDASVLGGLVRGACYIVCVDSAADFVSPGSLAGRAPTAADQGADDERDSDGVAGGGGFSCRSVTAGEHGENNHRLDFGYTCSGSFATVVPVGAGCGVPTILSMDAPVTGAGSVLTLQSGLPSTHVWFWASFGVVAPTALSPSGCLIYVDIPNAFLIGETFTNGFGTAQAVFPVPNVMGVEGLTFTVQASIWGGGGPIGDDSSSSAILATVGCL